MPCDCSSHFKVILLFTVGKKTEEASEEFFVSFRLSEPLHKLKTKKQTNQKTPQPTKQQNLKTEPAVASEKKCELFYF